MARTKVGIIGVGQMGEALIQALLPQKKQYSLQGTARSPQTMARVKKKFGISCHDDNVALVKQCQVIILCVKPYQVHELLAPLVEHWTPQHILVSICAGLTTAQLHEWTGGRPSVIRAMPNTPALIGQGMTALCGAQDVSSKDLHRAQAIFDAVGQTVLVEERLLDGVTGLSGCGPAYVYLMIEALSEAGVKVGLPRQMATLLAAQTLKGAAQMVLERGEHPAALKDEVTTPAGCTIDGLMALEEGRLRVSLIRAVLAATRRSIRMRQDS